MSNFCTSIQCMDGRIQEPIMRFLREHYAVRYVDTITEAGPCKILAENSNAILFKSIFERLEISVRKHKSKLIAISGHYDCAGNPCDEETQREQIKQSVQLCKSIYPDLEIVGLWVNKEWIVSHV